MYPFNALTVITPIVFFVLLLGFALIGFFAGWKRAAYWGGGNFLFYIIGLIIWKTSGLNIAKFFLPYILNALGWMDTGLEFQYILNSIITPVFFLVVVLIANIVLVICYYTFAKRLMKIGKYQKRLRRGQKPSVADKKWFNRLVGSIGLSALLLPTTLTTTHLVMMTTTDSGTRKTNGFVNGLYNGLQNTSKNLNWFSYYTEDDTGRDFDGIWGLVSLLTSTIEYKDPIQQDLKNIKTLSQAVVDTIGRGITNLGNITLDKNVTVETQETIKPLIDAVNTFTESWDSIVDAAREDISTVMNAPGITRLLKNVIAEFAKQIKVKIPLTNELLETQFLNKDSVFNQVVQGFIDGKLTTKDGKVSYFRMPSATIPVNADAFNNLVDALYSVYDVTNITDENKDALWESIGIQLCSIFKFQPQ